MSKDDKIKKIEIFKTSQANNYSVALIYTIMIIFYYTSLQGGGGADAECISLKLLHQFKIN